MVRDDHHVENSVAEGVLQIWVGPVVQEVIIDVLVPQAGSKCQGVLTIVCIA